MKRDLINELTRCMCDVKVDDVNKATATFVFDESFIGFDGHFLNNPVLPGVCKVLAGIEIIKIWENEKNLELKEIKLAKFFRPVTCNEELTFDCFKNKNAKDLLVRILISRGTEKVAELKLVF